MDGGDSDAIISSVERALKGDPRSADDLIAIATLQLQTDIVRSKTGIQSQAYLSAPESEKGIELQRLKAMLGEQLKLDVFTNLDINDSSSVTSFVFVLSFIIVCLVFVLV